MSEHSGVLPTLVSMVVCDQVIDDRLTNKKSAIGIFNTIVVTKVPSTIHHLGILASLTEISGRAELELRLVRDSDNAVLFSGKGVVEAPNPLAVVDLLFAMQGIQIPEVGQYAFELNCADEPLGRRRFQVLLRSGGPGAPPGEEAPEA